MKCVAWRISDRSVVVQMLLARGCTTACTILFIDTTVKLTMIVSPLLSLPSTPPCGPNTIPVTNPATGELLATLPDAGADAASQAIESAAKSMREQTPVELRSRWLAEIARLMLENKRELGRIITLEQGKPLKESIVEVEYAAGFFSFFSTQLEHLKSETIPQTIRNCRWTIHHRPAGVVALITPWNFPLAMLAKKLAPALG